MRQLLYTIRDAAAAIGFAESTVSKYAGRYLERGVEYIVHESYVKRPSDGAKLRRRKLLITEAGVLKLGMRQRGPLWERHERPRLPGQPPR